MSKKARISLVVRRKIFERALAYPRRSRGEVVQQLNDDLAHMSERPLARETLEKMVSTARGQDSSVEDEQWALTARAERSIDPVTLTARAEPIIDSGSMPAVLRAWRIQRALGKSFTVREAKWVAKLGALGANTLSVMDWAESYAARERACEAMNKPLDTEDLDASLRMWPWERVTAHLVSGRELSFSLVTSAGQPPDLLRFDREILSAVALWTELEFGMHTSFPVRDGPEKRYKADPNSEKAREYVDRLASEEAVWVYILWLRHLGRGPQIGDMDVKERVEVVLRLRAWVAEHPWRELTAAHGPLDALMLCWDNLRPTELLERVGLEIQKQPTYSKAEKTMEDRDERTLGQTKQEFLVYRAESGPRPTIRQETTAMD